VGRRPLRSAASLFVFDAGYDPVRLQQSLEGCCAQILVRLNSGRTFYFDLELPPKRPVGRPSRHGEKFDLKDPGSWQTYSRTLLPDRRLRPGAGQGMVGLAPQDPKSQRALRVK
jgi:hypothetical protein